jgi:hypothetical protein
MSKPYKNVRGLISAQVSLQLATAALNIVQLGTIDLSAGTIVVRAFLEDIYGILAAADIAAATGNQIHVSLTFKYANVPDGAGV